jgi:hypothetical protein
MVFNASDIINNTIPTAFSPYTDFFQDIVGNRDVFYLVPLIALTLGIWFKTEEPIMAAMFMIGAGGILGTSTLFIGVYSLGILFTIFAAIGLTILVISLVLNRRG